MPAQTVKGVRLTAPSDALVWTDTTVNIGSTTGPVSFFAVAVVNGGGSTISVDGIKINGTSMVLEADRSMGTDLGIPGRYRAARLDGVTVSGALSIEVTKSSAAAGRVNLVFCWADQSGSVANIGYLAYAAGASFSASVTSTTDSQAAFLGLFNASVSVTPTAPTVFPQQSAVDAIGLLNGSTELRLGALAEPGAASSALQATLSHAFTPGGTGWVASFAPSSGAPTGPTITTQPQPVSVVAGAVANFSVAASASGGGALSYQWRFNGADVSGATSSTYARTTVLGDNGGLVSVVVTETGGTSAGSTTSSNALLTVTASGTAPTVITNPTSQSVTAGASVTFTAAFSGSTPMTYQWSRNGSAISGATSASYTFSTVIGDNGATFTCAATNAFGGPVSTSAATLTVTAATTWGFTFNGNTAFRLTSFAGGGAGLVSEAGTQVVLVVQNTSTDAEVARSGTLTADVNGYLPRFTHASLAGPGTSYDVKVKPVDGRAPYIVRMATT